MPYARSGKLRVLGMTSARRTRSDPDVPTIAASGLPGYEATHWHALIAPKGLNRTLVDRLNGEIRKIVSTPEMEKMLLSNGIEPDGGTPEKLAEYIRKDLIQWRTVIARANIRVD
jgi:tripartite-type tricarboxylate transporter receptor subunit TctC